MSRLTRSRRSRTYGTADRRGQSILSVVEGRRAEGKAPFPIVLPGLNTIVLGLSEIRTDKLGRQYPIWRGMDRKIFKSLLRKAFNERQVSQ